MARLIANSGRGTTSMGHVPENQIVVLWNHILVIHARTCWRLFGWSHRGWTLALIKTGMVHPLELTKVFRVGRSLITAELTSLTNAYLGILVWPVGLHMERAFYVFNDVAPQVWWGLLILALAITQLAWGRGQRGLAMSWGLLWFGAAHTKGDELTLVEPDGTLVSGDVVQNKVVPNIYGDGGTPSSWLASSVPCIARVAMRISSAVMHVGLKNTSQAAAVSDSARCRGSVNSAAVSAIWFRDAVKVVLACSMTAVSSPSRSPK